MGVINKGLVRLFLFWGANRHPPPGDDGPVGLAPLPARNILTQFFNQGVMIVLENKNQNQDWYSNKDLYEMMVDLSKGLEATNAELAKTQTMIRDYNGLRERIDKCEQQISLSAGQGKGSKEMWGYVVGGIGLLLALISYATR